MRIEYTGLSEIKGSLVALDGVKGAAYDELAEVSKPMYRMQGIHRDLLPVEKEAEL